MPPEVDSWTKFILGALAGVAAIFASVTTISKTYLGPILEGLSAQNKGISGVAKVLSEHQEAGQTADRAILEQITEIRKEHGVELQKLAEVEKALARLEGRLSK